MGLFTVHYLHYCSDISCVEKCAYAHSCILWAQSIPHTTHRESTSLIGGGTVVDAADLCGVVT